MTETAKAHQTEPMKLLDATAEQYEDIFNWPEWWLEQKMDGMRLMVTITKDGIQFNLRSTAATQWYEKLTQELQFLADACNYEDVIELDGEIMIEDGSFWVFDMPRFRYADGGLEPDDTYQVRRAALEELSRHSECFQVVPVAKTEAEKRSLWLAVNQGNREGVVAKFIYGTYLPGIRTNRMLKMKITHTIDCVVVERNQDGSCNAVLGLWTPDAELQIVGRSSMIGREHIEVGSVVEVTYMCIRDPKNPTLYQPRVVKERTDKLSGDCMIHQIDGTFSNKEVVR